MLMRAWLAFLLAFSLSLPLSAADLFQLTVTSGGTSEQQSYSSAGDLPNYDTIQQQFTNVSDWNTSALDLTLNYRGIDLVATYAQNSTTVSFEIPELNRSWTFTGTSRTSSWDQLSDALAQQEDLVNELLRLMAKTTPNDPVAGNPSSLMDGLVTTDFNAVFLAEDPAPVSPVSSGVTSVSADTTEQAEAPNTAGIGLGYSSYEQGSSSVNTTLLPLSYTWMLDAQGDRKLTFRFPLSQVEVDGVSGYAVGLGLSYFHTMNPNWSLTPAFNYGVTASEGLGSGGALISLAVTSIYDLELSPVTLRFGNQVGQYQSQPLSVGGTTYDANLSNVAFRNGLIVQFSTDQWVANSQLEPYVIDTRYTGTELYIMQYYEFGLTFNGWLFPGSFLTLNQLSAEDGKASGTSLLFRALF
jgi:hypothetical protein